MNPRRVQWQENRDGELFFVIADQTSSGEWELFERSTWEVRWCPIREIPGFRRRNLIARLASMSEHAASGNR